MSQALNVSSSREEGQGVCLSLLLFALSIETLSNSIRQNTNVKGIKDDWLVEHRISLFSNDFLILLREPCISILALWNDLKAYGEVSR